MGHGSIVSYRSTSTICAYVAHVYVAFFQPTIARHRRRKRFRMSWNACHAMPNFRRRFFYILFRCSCSAIHGYPLDAGYIVLFIWLFDVVILCMSRTQPFATSWPQANTHIYIIMMETCACMPFAVQCTYPCRLWTFFSLLPLARAIGLPLRLRSWIFRVSSHPRSSVEHSVLHFFLSFRTLFDFERNSNSEYLGKMHRIILIKNYLVSRQRNSCSFRTRDRAFQEQTHFCFIYVICEMVRSPCLWTVCIQLASAVIMKNVIFKWPESSDATALAAN